MSKAVEDIINDESLLNEVLQEMSDPLQNSVVANVEPERDISYRLNKIIGHISCHCNIANADYDGIVDLDKLNMIESFINITKKKLNSIISLTHGDDIRKYSDKSIEDTGSIKKLGIIESYMIDHVNEIDDVLLKNKSLNEKCESQRAIILSLQCGLEETEETFKKATKQHKSIEIALNRQIQNCEEERENTKSSVRRMTEKVQRLELKSRTITNDSTLLVDQLNERNEAMQSQLNTTITSLFQQSTADNQQIQVLNDEIKEKADKLEYTENENALLVSAINREHEQDRNELMSQIVLLQKQLEQQANNYNQQIYELQINSSNRSNDNLRNRNQRNHRYPIKREEEEKQTPSGSGFVVQPKSYYENTRISPKLTLFGPVIGVVNKFFEAGEERVVGWHLRNTTYSHITVYGKLVCLEDKLKMSVMQKEFYEFDIGKHGTTEITIKVKAPSQRGEHAVYYILLDVRTCEPITNPLFISFVTSH